MNSYFFCANRYAKELVCEEYTFPDLATAFSHPHVSTDKDSIGIFPGHYTQAHREIQYIDYHTLLAIDIDSHDDVIKLLSYITSSHEFLQTFNYIIYSTYSSTATALRARLLIDVGGNNITIDDYPAAIRTVSQKLELTFDKCSYKRNSFVYIPNIAPGGDFIFYKSITGRPFTKDDIDENCYYNHDGITSPDVFNQSSDSSDPEHISYETLHSMIMAIDPDCEYDEWFRILAAVHHYSSGAYWGYELVNDWSSHGRKYVGPGEVQSKWESFKPASRPVTVGTIVYIANKYRWTETHFHNVSVLFKREIVEKKEFFNVNSYLDDFCKRVSNYQFDALTREDLEYNILDAVLEVRGIKNASYKTSIKRHIADRCQYGGIPVERSEKERSTLMPPWMRDWVLVTNMSTESMFVNARRPLSSESGIILCSSTKFNDINTIYAPKPGYDLAHDAIHVHRIPQVSSVVFAPKKPTVFPSNDGGFSLNSFLNDESFYHPPTDKLTPVQEQIQESLSRFFEYFMPNEKQRRIFLNFLAYNIFKFGSKVNWAPFIISSEGYGKDLVMRILEIALGKYRRHYLKLSGHVFFDARWTAMQEHRAFVYVNEVMIYDHNNRNGSISTYNKVKDLITETRGILVTQKYQINRAVDQVTNYAFSSNFYDAMSFPDTERRLFVCWPERNHADLVLAKAEVRTHMNVLWQIVNASGVGEEHGHVNQVNVMSIRSAVLSWFYQWTQRENIDEDFTPLTHAYKTDVFHEMTESVNYSHRDLIKEKIHDTAYKYASPTYVFITPLIREITEASRNLGIKEPVKIPVIQTYLRDLGYRDLKELINHDPTIDTGSVIPGPFKMRSKVFIHQAHFDKHKTNFEKKDSVTTVMRKFYEDYLLFIKQKEFIEAQQDAELEEHYKSVQSAFKTPSSDEGFFH